jgi:Tfp pilus assembly protein PilN
MDAQFMMVPKTWIHKLLIVKLLNLCTSLAHELNFLHCSIEEEKEEGIFLEEQIDNQINQMKTIQKVNKLAVESKALHESFVDEIERIEKKVIN